MTAEVIILNKSAVALAADSAVTVGEGDAGKTYNTVNKVFTLSKHYPVGVMIYANAEYMGIPFETIIKMYRQGLGRRPEARIDDYATKFTHYLGGTIFTSEQQQAANAQRMWHVVFDAMNDDIRNLIRAELRSKGDCTATRRKDIITSISERHLTALESAAVFPGFDKKTPSAITRQYKAQYEAAKDANIVECPNKVVEVLWRKLAGLAITKQHDYPMYSGVVVTGFGESEVFPQYTLTQVSGIVAGVRRSQVTGKQGIAHDGPHSGIVPFAQSEMVGRFMDGVDRSYENYVAGSTIDALRTLANAIIDVHVPGAESDKDATKSEVEKLIVSSAAALRDNANEWRRKRFVNPILDALINLPKEDLANLAEALVNLTSIKRRVSTERETVGGPIDVAVISKGDGFVWSKRKHYFRPELNPQFAANYWSASKKEDAGGRP
jgi:hypothetical protein